MIKKLYYTLVGHRSRPTYWTHSKLANWARARLSVEIPPSCATAREWREYNKRNKAKFGYWLVEEGIDTIQDIVMFIPDVYRNIRIRITNRFVDRSWCLDTKLDRWDYYEVNTRIIHGLFETLVDFVEHEKANMMYISDSWRDDDDTIAQASRKAKKVFPSREKGLEYLDWEINLGDESPHQSDAAREVKELYLWWKDVRPNRPDPMDESGWSAYCEQQRQGCTDDFWCIFDHEDYTEEEAEAATTTTTLDRLHEIEKQQTNEDTEQLIRLIKIRDGLWT